MDPLPLYRNGDAEILLTRKPEDRLVLQRPLLEFYSSFFMASFHQRWSDNDDSSDVTNKWRYELTFDAEGMGLLCRRVLPNYEHVYSQQCLG